MNQFRSGIFGAGALLALAFSSVQGANAWKNLPVGTELEYQVVTEESTSQRDGTKRTEGAEVWRVTSSDGQAATIEITSAGSRQQVVRNLATDDLPKVSPPWGQGASAGGPDGQDHFTVVTERIDTLRGPRDGVRVDHRLVRLESESSWTEWRVPGIPEPVRVSRVDSGGAGVVRTIRTMRTLVRMDVPQGGTPTGISPAATGASWRDCAVGTNFDVQVQRVRQGLYPPGQAPETETVVEHWRLERKDETSAYFSVMLGERQTEASRPLGPEPRPAEGSKFDGPEDHRVVRTGRETIETTLGKFDCDLISRRHTMNEAGGEELEWRVAAFPIPVQTRAVWEHKQQKETETRKLVRFERVK